MCIPGLVEFFDVGAHYGRQNELPAFEASERPARLINRIIT